MNNNQDTPDLGPSRSTFKARQWAPRACDRCRRRKARCDEAVPCKNCADSGVACTRHAPVRRRGPKPRNHNSDLEDRLRNLEHLISTIPGSSSSPFNRLSTAELNQIRHAAQLVIPPDTGESLADSSGSVVETTPRSHLGTVGEGVVDRMIDMTGTNTGHGHTGPSQDLLYRDSEGQTKYLGPSSGMPLLDRLRSTMHQPPTHPAAEEWVSLSAALGIDIGHQSLPIGSGSTQMETVHRVEHGADDQLWSNMTSTCPQDLIDNLIRAYFTISHLLWPILHAPTFMSQYFDPTFRRDPSFTCLVLSICCLSSRYAHDIRLTSTTIATDLLMLTKITLREVSVEKSDLFVVQALFNMSVVQEGTAQPNLLWLTLTQALSMAYDLGLHRQADEWESFTAVDVEVRKRTMWAIYCQHIKASTTYGRPPMICLNDLDLEEPSAVDDVYINDEHGVGLQPLDRPSVMAGFVAALRLHMLLERTIRRINHGARFADSSSSFISLASASTPSSRIHQTHDSDIELLSHVTVYLPGDWTFLPDTIIDPDSVRFFQKTRVFALQQFIRLLVARHRFWQVLENGPTSGEEVSAVIAEITQPALGIIGAYCAIDSRARLGFFGAHAIAQLTQAGAGLIGVLLHLRSNQVDGIPITENDPNLQLALQGLPACIQVLSRLGERRPAGLRAAQLLAEFSRACQIPVFASPGGGTDGQVVVPMLRSLPRRESVSASGPGGSGGGIGGPGGQSGQGATGQVASPFQDGMVELEAWLSMALGGQEPNVMGGGIG